MRPKLLAGLHIFFWIDDDRKPALNPSSSTAASIAHLSLRYICRHHLERLLSLGVPKQLHVHLEHLLHLLHLLLAELLEEGVSE